MLSQQRCHALAVSQDQLIRGKQKIALSTVPGIRLILALNHNPVLLIRINGVLDRITIRPGSRQEIAHSNPFSQSLCCRKRNVAGKVYILITLPIEVNRNAVDIGEMASETTTGIITIALHDIFKQAKALGLLNLS